MVIRSICGGGWGKGQLEEEEEQIPTQITWAMSLSHSLQVAPAECQLVSLGAREHRHGRNCFSHCPVVAGIELLFELLLMPSVTQNAPNS